MKVMQGELMLTLSELVFILEVVIPLVFTFVFIEGVVTGFIGVVGLGLTVSEVVWLVCVLGVVVSCDILVVVVLALVK